MDSRAPEEQGMAVALEAHAPRARCTACGSAEIQALCHHCGRALCFLHSENPAPVGRGIELSEFEGLGLERATGTRAVHCPACVHWVRSYAWLRNLGLALLVAGAALAWLAPRLGWQPAWSAWLPAAAGLATALAGAGLQATRRRRAWLAARPPVPLLPTLAALEAREHVTGRATLSASGEYEARLLAAEGRLEAALRWRPEDRERVRLYRALYELAPESGIDFHAGFLALTGAVELGAEEAAEHAASPGVIALCGRTLEQAFLHDEGSRATLWRVTRPYALGDASASQAALPLAVLPSLVPGEAGRVLELRVSTPAPGAHAPGSPLAIEELTLELPPELGSVDVVEPASALGPGPGPGGEPPRTLAWQDLAFRPEERAAGEKSVLLRLAAPLRTDGTLRGRARVRFDGAFAGLEDVRPFDPLGQPLSGARSGQPGPPPAGLRRVTTVTLEFELELGALRSHEPRREERRLACEGVQADDALVLALVEALAERDVHVARVCEEPERAGAPGTGRLRRTWEIHARTCADVAPIDLCLVLVGERDPRRAAHEGVRTSVAIEVRGQEPAAALVRPVARAAAELEALVEGVLQRTRPAGAELQPAPRRTTPDRAAPARIEELRPRRDARREEPERGPRGSARSASGEGEA